MASKNNKTVALTCLLTLQRATERNRGGRFSYSDQDLYVFRNVHIDRLDAHRSKGVCYQVSQGAALQRRHGCIYWYCRDA